MTDLARLTLVADASGMAPAEKALDQLAQTGSRVEGSVKLNTQAIEKAMASLGNVMGGLGGTMKSLEAAVTKSMARTAQETQQSARSFDDLRRMIDPAFAASQRFADVQRELAAFVASGAAEQAQANAVLEIARSRYLGIATAAEAAEQAQREQAAAVAMATSNYQAMRASIDPIYAASKRYEAAIEAADAALKAKIITEQQHARDLKAAAAQMLAPSAGLQGMAVAADTAKTGLSRFAPAIQNVGFQIQDFAVQVASGQSAMIAFTQQFPQLAGALGMSGTLALVGTALGTIVAVGMAAAPMFFDLGKGAKSAKDAIDDLTDAVGLYRKYADDAASSSNRLTGQIGGLAGEAARVNEALAQIARLEAFDAMEAAMESLTEKFGGFSKAQSDLYETWVNGQRIVVKDFSEFEQTVDKIRVGMKITQPQAVKVAEALERVGAAPLGKQAQAAADFNQAMVGVFGSVEAIPPELREIVKGTLQVGELCGEMGDGV